MTAAAGGVGAANNATVVVVEDAAFALADLRQRMSDVRDLCEERRTYTANGERTDVETIWPSEVLAILDS